MSKPLPLMTSDQVVQLEEVTEHDIRALLFDIDHLLFDKRYRPSDTMCEYILYRTRYIASRLLDNCREKEEEDE